MPSGAPATGGGSTASTHPDLLTAGGAIVAGGIVAAGIAARKAPRATAAHEPSNPAQA